MNDFGLIVIGTVVRGTVVAAFGALLVLVVRRRGPAAGIVAATTSLTVLAGLTLFAASPWPRWWTIDPARVDTVVLSRGSVSDVEPEVAKSAEPRSGRPVAGPVKATGKRTPLAQESWLSLISHEIERELERAPAAKVQTWRWPAWIALAFLTGLALGLARLVLGVRAVIVLRSRARPINDQALIDLVAVLRAEMCCTKRVLVFESAALTTPATVGWRHPALLLPLHWRDWDNQERRVVVAHELAHICRNDYALGLAAQVSLALHFYHPLAYWLAGQLRLHQELAADAWGARLAGGSRRYLATLAQMALRQPERPIGWPARALLPTRGMFLRRIEMLRNANHVPDIPLPRRTRVLTIAALAVAGLLVAGLRGPESPAPLRAQEAAPAGGQGYDLAYVPGDAAILLAARPADLLGRPEFAEVVAFINRDILGRGPLHLQVERIDQLMAFWGRNAKDSPSGGPRGPLIGTIAGLVLRTNQPQDWKKVAQDFIKNPEEVVFEGRVYVRSKTIPDSIAYCASDDRTLILASQDVLKSMLKMGPNSRKAHVWDNVWNRLDKGQLAIALDSAWFRDQVNILAAQSDPAAPQMLSAYSPVWAKTRAVALGVNAVGGLKIDARASCASTDDAKQVGQTCEALLILARNMMQGVHTQAEVLRKQGRQVQRWMSPLLIPSLIDPVLASAKVRVDSGEGENTVRIAATTDLDFAELSKSLLPAVTNARANALRTQSMNNLKQIGLAMWNYHNDKGHFPPAVGIGPDGKTRFSWRVAILPYLAQEELYNQYRFDEPWDGPNNRKLIAKIPPIYRHPGAGGDPTRSTYFVLTGPDTLFPDNKGTAIPTVRDGTSYTIAVVEAKRDIPWTKPEDIPYDAKGPLPELGGLATGGFHLLFADGAVRYMADTIKPEVLRAMITPSSGEAINDF